MISVIDLNPAVDEQDIINVFIIYKISSYAGSYWTRNGLFGHDNDAFDKFVSFSDQGHLIVACTTNYHIVIG